MTILTWLLIGAAVGALLWWGTPLTVWLWLNRCTPFGPGWWC